jgi:endo-1,4-beta-xylanase
MKNLCLRHAVFARNCTSILFYLYAISVVAQQQPIPLWPVSAQASAGQNTPETVRINQYGEHIVSNVHNPSITPYFPAKGKDTGAAVVIAPGGGHSELWMDHEGYRVAQWLSDHGVAAFVLKYRLARAKGSTYTIEGDELADAQRAIRLVKSHAADWSIDPNRVGIMGFSAGGELAVLAATRYADGKRDTSDAVERESSKPAFQGLFYPVIPKDMNISKETPPAFLACGEDDHLGIAENLPKLYLELKRAGVSAELHIYAKTGHGFGLRPTNPAPVSDWPQLFYDWLNVEGFLNKQ